jgi:hypothetical protein
MLQTTELSPIARSDAAASRHPDDLLTSVELALSLKVSERAPENWRQHGIGPTYMRAGGRRVLYRWADVLTWLNDRRFTSTAEESSAA